MGRRRKVAVDPELITPDHDLQTPKPPRQMVEAEHTIRFRKPLDVATLEPETEEEPDPENFEEPEIEESDGEQPRRRTTLSFRAKLKQELSGRGIGSDEQLRLRIDRLPFYDVNGNTGINAEKEFVRNIPCSKEFVLNDEYLDEVAKSCGPGAYWFTLRHKNTIVKMWHMKISSPPIAPAAAAIAQPGEVPAQAAVAATAIFPPHLTPPIAPVPPRTFKQELKDFVETTRMVRELSDAATPETAPKTETNPDPEIALFKLLARDESLMDRLSKGALGKLLGGAPVERDEWAEVAMEAIKSGQAPQIIKSTIDAVFSGIGNLFPKGNSNGQAPMAPTQLQNQTQPGNQQQDRTISGQEMGQVAAAGDAAGGVEGDVHQHNPPQDTQLSPEDELIYALIGAMARQAPIPETHALINIAIFKAPWLRESIDDLINLPIDQILAFVTAYHPPVAEMAHAREWLESLIAALTVNGQEGQ